MHCNRCLADLKKSGSESWIRPSTSDLVMPCAQCAAFCIGGSFRLSVAPDQLDSALSGMVLNWTNSTEIKFVCWPWPPFIKQYIRFCSYMFVRNISLQTSTRILCCRIRILNMNYYAVFGRVIRIPPDSDSQNSNSEKKFTQLGVRKLKIFYKLLPIFSY